MVKLFAGKGILYYLLIMATLRTAAIKINKVTIYLVYNLLKNTSQVGSSKDMDGFNSFKLVGLYINSQTKIDWQEKYLLIINKVSLLSI